MKPEDLLYAFTDLDEDLVTDAQVPMPVRRSRPRLSTVLLAAVLAGMLLLSACAAADGFQWFRDYFSDRSGGILSSGQNAYITQNTESFRQSKTMNGYTISLESAISDGVAVYIKCRAEAPEGTVLDTDSYGITNWQSFELVNEYGESLILGGGWETVDDNPADNVISLLYTANNSWYEEEIDKMFGSTWRFCIRGLFSRHRVDPPEYVRDEELVTGLWEFKVTFPEGGNTALEFISDPVTVPCHVWIGANQQQEVQITSLKVRALGASLTFRYPGKESVNGRFDALYAVMQDGSRVLMREDYGSPNFLTYTFDAPIVLEEIDHILLPNGTRLKAP